MATTLATIIADARVELKETTASYWTDAELLQHLKKGINDLWGAVLDLNGAHYRTTDITNVSLAANTETLTGVPADVFRVELIEPRDLSSGASGSSVMFHPRSMKGPEARNARQLSAQDITAGLDIFYELEGAGSPIAAPTIRVAPQISTALNLRLIYLAGPATAAMTTASNNPIGGESDMALMAWCIAYARVKEREDRSPDPNWLAIYATEKSNILTRMAPRQSQEPEVVEDIFGGY